MTFAERLSELRRKKRMTQKELTEALHLAKSRISSYENELSMPGIGTLGDIADFFGVSIDYLLCRTEYPYEAHFDPERKRVIRLPENSTDEQYFFIQKLVNIQLEHDEHIMEK